jgi:group I intron endonuclease
MPSALLVYGLCDPRTQELRYIGKSCTGLDRPKRHWRTQQELSRKSIKTSWVKSVLKDNFEPEVVVIEEYSTREAMADGERFWIEYFRFIGANLTNMTPGGDGGGGKWSAETRRKQEELNRDPEVIARKKAAAQKRTWSPEDLAKRAAGVRKMSAEGRNVPMLGKKHSEETKTKMAQSHLDGKKILRSDGVVFLSISDAARAINRAPSNVSLVLRKTGYKGKKLKCAGFSFSWCK